jgi:hypothetical protein
VVGKMGLLAMIRGKHLSGTSEALLLEPGFSVPKVFTDTRATFLTCQSYYTSQLQTLRALINLWSIRR